MEEFHGIQAKQSNSLMGISDMMGSGRGMGLMGTLLGILVGTLVLAGFFVLYLFGSEASLGGGPGVESVVASQKKELAEYRANIEQAKRLLELAPERHADEAEMKELTRKLVFIKGGIGSLRDSLADLREEIDGLIADGEAYKEAYRASERRQAVGEKLAVLQTKDGKSYTAVEIREVDAVGVLIRHEDGQRRIPFDVLPDAMQDRFQFDAASKTGAPGSPTAPSPPSRRQ
jgi:hypothetical protein